MAEYKATRKELRRTIMSIQRQCWKALCADLDKDPWGLGYKIVRRELGAPSCGASMDAATIDGIVDALLPTHPKRRDTESASLDPDPPTFTEQDLKKAVSCMRNNKAPRPDGIPTEVLKVVVESHPDLMLEMYNSCLKAGTFYVRWKLAGLVLIEKGKGSPGNPSAYRPLCVLDTAGKLLKKVIRPRLQQAVEAAGGLSDRQYGFRNGRSTIGAIEEVVCAAGATRRGNHFSRPVCLVALLDVKNAFNTVRCTDALSAMQHDFQVPEYILHMIRSYLMERYIVYKSSDGSKRRELTAGAAQGSVLGSDLWNISYGGLLRMEMPEGTSLVGYADDVAAVIMARDVEAAQMRLNQIMRRVS